MWVKVMDRKVVGGWSMTNRMNVHWSLDHARVADGDNGLCQICGEPAVLMVDGTRPFCGVRAYRTRINDLQPVRLFRAAIG